MTPQDYLDAALTIMQQHALKAAAFDWASTRDATLTQAARLMTPSDTYPIIAEVLRRLGDRHSYFLTPPEVQRELDGYVNQPGLLVAHPSGIVIEVAAGSPAAAAGIHVGDSVTMVNGGAVAGWEVDAFNVTLRSPSLALVLRDADGRNHRSLTVPSASFVPQAHPEGWLIQPTIGYVAVPTMQGPAALAQSYAEAMQAIIRDGAQQGASRWIVDLRRNTGGNMWPMLAGLGPLLGEESVGAFVYPDGEEEEWTYLHGRAALDGWTMAQVEHPYTPPQPASALAILLSRYTRSSGELVALALHGEARAQFFGEATDGVPTSLAPFALSDGALIMLSVAQGADRSGVTFDGPILPDHIIPVDWRRFATTDDPVIAAAMAWLSNRNVAL